MIKNFSFFLDESYLESNYAPLYHFTTVWSLNSIFKSNKLSLGFHDQDVEGLIGKTISLTRYKKFDINYKDFEVKICLDKNKLISNYNLKPYDFFYRKGDKKKWELNRVNPFEYEEIMTCEIKELNKYILYIDFFDLDLIFTYLNEIKSYVNKYDIECRISEKIIDINAI